MWQRVKNEFDMLSHMWSVRLAVLAGVVAAYLVANPMVLVELTVYLPERWRPAASALAGFLVFVLPTIIRRLPQPGLKNHMHPPSKPRSDEV
jgi:sorbitol-specific phosphotransferase system component IIC